MSAQRPAAGTRSHTWFFTRNQRDDEISLPAPWTSLPENSTFMLFQQEKGEADERPHYQGVVRFSAALRLGTVCRRLGQGGIHVEPCRDLNASIAYCSKSSTRVAGPWELGERPQPGKRSDLCAAADAVKTSGYESAFLALPQVFIKYPRGMKEYEFILKKQERRAAAYSPPRIWVLIGPSGSGKTRWATTSSDSWWMKPDNSNDWWDGYNYEDRIILDEFKCEIRLGQLKKLLDGNLNQVQTKGAHTVLTNREWVITSNLELDSWYSGVSQVERDALWHRLFHRFEACVWHTGLKAPVKCPCTNCLVPPVFVS